MEDGEGHEYPSDVGGEIDMARADTWSADHGRRRASPVPSSLDNGQRSPRKLLRSVVARLFGRKS